jgi:hypothetical protein
MNRALTAHDFYAAIAKPVTAARTPRWWHAGRSTDQLTGTDRLETTMKSEAHLTNPIGLEKTTVTPVRALLLPLIDVSIDEQSIWGAGHTLWRPLELAGADINR